jgi:large subunit ribosomal protein L1
MGNEGKKFKAAVAQVDRDKRYAVEEALGLVGKTGIAKFDESVDIAVRLNVNPKHADQMVRGAAVLPAGTGKVTRVLVFAKGDKEKEARDAGADFVGAEDLAEKIKTGWFEFDKAIATPDMMGLVGKLGKLLGTRGLMPNPKVGTVTQDIARAVRESKAGKVEFRVDKNGIIHTTIGRKSFAPNSLKDNFVAILETLMKLKPATVKGTYVKTVTVSCTMGPGIRIDTGDVETTLKVAK